MTALRIVAGASGYSFKEWKGHFYPEKMKPDEMLACYAERLPTVEINNTFYQMPKTAVLENWAQDDAGSFPFRDQGVAPHHPHVAAQGRQRRRLGDFPLHARSLRSGAKRGPVLFQLPPFLKKDLPRLERIP